METREPHYAVQVLASATTARAYALRAELERIARDTRFPDRLREIYAALDNDPVLVQEGFARPKMVDRLARDFFAFDRRIHAAARAEAEKVPSAQLVRGEIDILAEHPPRVDQPVASTGTLEVDRLNPAQPSLAMARNVARRLCKRALRAGPSATDCYKNLARSPQSR